jgi:type IV pilus assembly protein PilM
MAKAKTAWGIEIGQYAIKAIQLEVTGKGLRVVDFVVIPHDIVLTSPEVRSGGEEGALSKGATILEMSLAQLATQKKLEGKNVVISYTWMTQRGSCDRGIARFSSLPPIEKSSEIAGMVRYEAEQQIPFALTEVEWDYHAFKAEDTPDLQTGIFAIRTEPLEEFLALVSDKLGISPTAVTLSPIALYNALAYDRDIIDIPKPTVLLDIGTSSTDLVVADGARCWMRTFPIGGHDFTEAIVRQLEEKAAERGMSIDQAYRQADDRKQKSATSDDQKSILGAMKPVFGDLIGDIQKSLSFYQQQNKGTKFGEIIGLGSTFKIPGLRKYLGMQLQLEIERFEKFRKISVEGPQSAKFAEHAVSFSVAYGLALQGLGLAPVEINLLPTTKLRQQVWSSKTRWFAAAAAIGCAAGGLMFLRGVLNQSALGDVAAKSKAERVVATANSQKTALAAEMKDLGSKSKNMLGLLEDREVWPHAVSDALHAVAAGNDKAALSDSFDAEKAKDSRQAVLRSMSGAYKLVNGSSRVIEVTLEVEVNAGKGDINAVIADSIGTWLKDNKTRDGVPYDILNPKWSFTTMKVNADGSLVADPTAAAAQNAVGAQQPAAGPEGGDFSAPGGSFSAGDGPGNNFGGVSGKRTANSGGSINKPGGRLGGAGAGGGFSAGGQSGSDGANTGSSSSQPRYEGEGEKQSQSAVDLDKEAPIPSKPGLFAKDSEVYVAKITFDLKLKGEVAAAAAVGTEPAPEGE